MPKCPTCSKEVYFGELKASIALTLTLTLLTPFVAEKATSLGKDWHKACLKCAKCKKTLSPGGHAEVSH